MYASMSYHVSVPVVTSVPVGSVVTDGSVVSDGAADGGETFAWIVRSQHHDSLRDGTLISPRVFV
jgi:hypothetical protein